MTDAFFDPYPEAFYRSLSTRPGADEAYPAMATAIWNRFRPGTVIDVGCGTGNLLAQLNKCALDEGKTMSVWGVEAPETREVILQVGTAIHPARYFWVDLREPEPIPDGPFDLCVSIEVAEHLPERNAEEYVKFLCSLSDTIVFSAAYPGQGGTGHIHERSFDYWVRLFNEAEFAWVIDESRALQTQLKGRCGAAFWYERLHVFRRNGGP